MTAHSRSIAALVADLRAMARTFGDCTVGANCTEAADALARLPELELRLCAAMTFYEGVKECMGDTWECEVCGDTEAWWTESNADYVTRDAVAALAQTSSTVSAVTKEEL